MTPEDVAVLDTTTNTLKAAIKVGPGPFGVAVNEVRSTVYVADGGALGNTVSVIDAERNEYLTSDSKGMVLYREFQPHVFVEGVGWVDVDVTLEPPVNLAADLVRVGDRFLSSGTAKITVDGSWTFSVAYSAESVIEKKEKVSVPAGTFKVLRTQQKISAYGLTLSSKRWLAKDVGVVKDVTVNPQGVRASLRLLAVE
jgi:YVTN family beta-propeller protein